MSEQAFKELKEIQNERAAKEIAFYNKIAEDKGVSFQCALDICFLQEMNWRTQEHENYIIALDKAGLPPIKEWSFSKAFEILEIKK